MHPAFNDCVAPFYSSNPTCIQPLHAQLEVKSEQQRRGQAEAPVCNGIDREPARLLARTDGNARQHCAWGGHKLRGIGQRSWCAKTTESQALAGCSQRVSHKLSLNPVPTRAPTILCHVEQQQHGQDEQQVAAVPHENGVACVAGEDRDDEVLQARYHQDHRLLGCGRCDQWESWYGVSVCWLWGMSGWREGLSASAIDTQMWLKLVLKRVVTLTPRWCFAAQALTRDTQSGGTVITAARADSLASSALPAPSPLPTLQAGWRSGARAGVGTAGSGKGPSFMQGELWALPAAMLSTPSNVPVLPRAESWPYRVQAAMPREANTIWAMP